MPKPTFSFVIVTFNNADSIADCLLSVEQYTSDPFEVIVVDNSLDSETLTAIERHRSERPDVAVRAVATGKNLGFSRACNVGARLAVGKYLFFLNPDTKLLNDSARILGSWLDIQPLAAAAGPAIFDSGGRLTRTCRNLPTLSRIVLDATGLDSWVGAYRLTRFRHDQPKQVEQIIGAALLVRRADYERLGGMDEQFFIYFEEVDLCKRLTEAGGEIWFQPEARVQHIGGKSCEVNSVRARMIYILRESRKKYFRKHFGYLGGVAVELVNRLEGLEKALILGFLWLVQRQRTYREKALGFWAVAIGTAPPIVG